MGVVIFNPSLYPLLMVVTLCFFFFFLRPSSAADTFTAQNTTTSLFEDGINSGSSNNGSVIGDMAAGYPSPSPPPPPPNEKTRFSPFRPSIAVIVGVLTTMFSITFLLLLYAKHCKRGNLLVVGYGGYHPSSGAAATISADRKNSGIDRAVVESLPVFRFGSLLGQKDGLECAVCLTRFESSEVLRLLPKCKHAFHVECVDIWLDAHSTCPLCRYRVDPEDILLVENANILPQNQQSPSPPSQNDVVSDFDTAGDSETRNTDESNPAFRRVSGRHSSAGERGSGVLQVVVQRPGETGSSDPASFRRSVDDSSSRKKRESVAVGCFDRSRKDGLLLTQDRKMSSEQRNRPLEQRNRLEHRIIVSPGPGCGRLHQRWSDVQPWDLLYLRSEMIISDSRRFSSASGSRPSVTRQQQNAQVAQQLYKDGKGQEEGDEEWGSIGIDGNSWSGRRVINSRSVSEITGLSRFTNDSGIGSNDSHQRHHRRHQRQQRQQQQAQAQAGMMSRWLAWVSQLRPAVGSERNADH